MREGGHHTSSLNRFVKRRIFTINILEVFCFEKRVTQNLNRHLRWHNLTNVKQLTLLFCTDNTMTKSGKSSRPTGRELFLHAITCFSRLLIHSYRGNKKKEQQSTSLLSLLLCVSFMISPQWVSGGLALAVADAAGGAAARLDFAGLHLWRFGLLLLGGALGAGAAL